MKINKIILKDLFSFNGKQELLIDDNVIILGENGFGKTSLLNSIKLGLGKKFDNETILNNNSIDKMAFIKIEFDEFKVIREWDFNNKIENLKIEIDENIFENEEAEEFLKEKLPVELLDFLFFDGEVEKKDLISKPIKKLFEYVFDLDIFSNMIKDTKSVVKLLSEKIETDELDKFKILQQEEIELDETILKLEEDKKSILENIKTLNKNLNKCEKQLKNRSSKLLEIENQISQNSENLMNAIDIFKEINLYQLPLILNEKLQNSLNEQNEKTIQIIDKTNFEIQFKRFIDKLSINTSTEKALEEFYNYFDKDNKLKIEFNKEDLKNLLNRIKNFVNEKQELEKRLNDIKKELLKKEFFQKLETEKRELENRKNELELKIIEIDEKCENSKIKLKEIQKEIRLEFISKRDKFSKIKSIEELKQVSEIAKELYEKKLTKNLKEFNEIFGEKLLPFLSKYNHIETIYIDKDFHIVMKDRDGKILNKTLLSSGQKQLLTFILLNSILEFSKFTDFIFIDTPLGRLSSENREFIFDNYYIKFNFLILLVTSSEYEFLANKSLNFNEYKITKNSLGSQIGKIDD